jgi:hypothetical protein
MLVASFKALLLLILHMLYPLSLNGTQKYLGSMQDAAYAE